MGPYVFRGLLGVILVVCTVGAISRLSPRDNKRETKFNTDASGNLESAVVFGEQNQHYVSAFRSGKIDTVMGKTTLDLTEATMEGNEARMKVSVVMGDVEIRVPRGWTVSRRGLGIIFGNMDNKTTKVADRENSKILVVTGEVVFGNLVVRN